MHNRECPDLRDLFRASCYSIHFLLDILRSVCGSSDTDAVTYTEANAGADTVRGLGERNRHARTPNCRL